MENVYGKPCPTRQTHFQKGWYMFHFIATPADVWRNARKWFVSRFCAISIHYILSSYYNSTCLNLGLEMVGRCFFAEYLSWLQRSEPTRMADLCRRRAAHSRAKGQQWVVLERYNVLHWTWVAYGRISQQIKGKTWQTAFPGQSQRTEDVAL